MSHQNIVKVSPRDHSTLRRIALIMAVTLLLPQLALAQSYTLPASTVGSGGGTVASSSYSLSGTVGQSAVGALTSGAYNG